MSSMSRFELFDNLGYSQDPFKACALFETGDMVRAKRILALAVNSHAMVCIVGVRGIGKSLTVAAALNKIGVRKITLHRSEKERCTIADIERAIILDLCEEAPRGGGETRTRQVRRIVGEASSCRDKRPIVVVIEEAQRLHSNTLKSLKTLREIEWAGNRELFSVVLISQSDPMNRAGVSEVRLRTDSVWMQGITTDEAAGYVKATIGEHFEESAITALSELPQARNWLELQALCLELLNYTLAAGRQLVTDDDVSVVSKVPTAAKLPKVQKRMQLVDKSNATIKDALASVIASRTLEGVAA